MRTVKEVEKQERVFKRRSIYFKWIRKHINHRLGDFLVSKNYDMWFDYLN